MTVTKKRRYRYYRIASPLVASMLESIKAVAAIEVPPRHQPRSAEDDALRLARTCYDHLAGKLGVALADALVANGSVVLTPDGGEVTDAGMQFLGKFGRIYPPSRAGGFSAGRAWIGASAAIISPARSARRSASIAWTSAGWRASGIPARCGSPPPGVAACATHSASSSELIDRLGLACALVKQPEIVGDVGAFGSFARAATSVARARR